MRRQRIFVRPRYEYSNALYYRSRFRLCAALYLPAVAFFTWAMRLMPILNTAVMPARVIDHFMPPYNLVRREAFDFPLHPPMFDAAHTEPKSYHRQSYAAPSMR